LLLKLCKLHLEEPTHQHFDLRSAENTLMLFFINCQDVQININQRYHILIIRYF
jgi:hypothetical protein